MPKLKTNRASRKRFKVTASGKVKRKKAFKAHKLLGKSRKRKRRLGKPGLVSDVETRRVKRLLGRA